MRGGTSKGVFFRLQDLPEAAQFPARPATPCCCA
jgi:2-methylaconitate cis-trans-isomerase PrpF